MRKNSPAADWQQWFPTYKAGAPGIVLAEYEAAANQVQADERAVAITNGILVTAAAPLAPIVAQLIESTLPADAGLEDLLLNGGIALVCWFVFTVTIASYVCHLRRTYVHAARKVVVLRRMLGQSYGAVTLVLPNWRLEGADNPFSIKLFPGWSIAAAYPFYALVFMTSSIAAFGFYYFANTHLDVDISPLLGQASEAKMLALALGSAFFVVTLVYVRSQLFDLHESFGLGVTKVLAALLRVRLVPGFQTTWYNAQLSRREALRLNTDFSSLKPFAVFREDRSFYENWGFEPKALVRAVWHRIRGKRAGGGSTITQQLARTLFIVDLQKRWRRKLIEIPLAVWLNRQIDKSTMLEIYLSSVRYANGVLGVVAAYKHFFGPDVSRLSPAQAFVLLERISSITNHVRTEGVRRMINDFQSEGLLDQDEALDIVKLYRDLAASGKLVIDDAFIELAAPQSATLVSKRARTARVSGAKSS